MKSTHVCCAIVLVTVALSAAAQVDLTPTLTKGEQKRIADELWKRTDLKIGVAVATAPEMDPHTRVTDAYGSQLRGFDNDMPRGAEQKLAALGKGDGEAELDLVAKMITSRFTRRGLTATPITDRIPVRSLERYKPPKRGDWAREDFRVYKNQYSIDVLVLLEVRDWGTVRSAANFESSPIASGFMNAQLRIIRLDDNALIGMISIPWEEQVDMIGSAWDVPPDYTALQEGMLVAVRRSAQKLMSALTSTAPTP